jgi:hypothetical protein
MSNSKRKIPIFPNCNAASEKFEKQKANRKIRRLVKEKLSKAESDLPKLREVSSKWNWSKDGKSYRIKLTEKQLSK